MSNTEKCNISSNNNIHALESVELVHSGEDYFSRMQQIISRAQIELHLQTYIFENDAIGIKIAESLKEAASRNVKVYVILDAYGSASLPNKVVDDLLRHGIRFRFFSPFFSRNNLYIGRRMHHKVLVADGRIALIGGINIACKYHGCKKAEPWLDYAVQVEGKIGESIQVLCRNIYNRKKRVRKKKIKPVFYSLKAESIRIIQNDWLKRKNEIYKSYIHSIRKAEKEIIIVGSYFLPGRKLTSILKQASRKGVKVKLILSGISDVPVIRRAACFLYASLLKHGIELYEWNKSVLHGKAYVVDNKLTSIGSFNLNHLSSFGSIEMNVEIYSAEFSGSFASHLDQVIAQCEKINDDTLKSRDGVLTKWKNRISYYLARFGMIIITYLPYKRFLKSYQNE